jgi:hypothetical protein
MKTKIGALAIWMMLLGFYMGTYSFAGGRGLIATLLASLMWAIMVVIVNNDREKQIELLDLHKAEVHNLRLAITEFQRTIHRANERLLNSGTNLPVVMPEVLPSVLPSVFDERKK